MEQEAPGGARWRWADRMGTLQEVYSAGSPESFVGRGKVRMRRSTPSVHTPIKHLQLFPCLFTREKFSVSSELKKKNSNSLLFSFFHVQFCIHPTGCMVVSHLVNPLSGCRS